MTDEKQIAKKLRDKFAQSYDDWDSGYRDIDFIIKKAKEDVLNQIDDVRSDMYCRKAPCVCQCCEEWDLQIKDIINEIKQKLKTNKEE